MEFSTILRNLRENRGYTQERLAEMLHISKNSISHYELGKSMPDISILTELTNVFDVSMDYLLGLTSANLSKDLLNRSYDKTVKVGEIIESILRLDREHRNDLLKMLRYIEKDNKR